MNDRGLLELAAKALGGEFDQGADCITMDGIEYEQWNPLTDDGDALRLAVRLSISIRFWGATNVVGSGPGCEIEHWEPVGTDPLAATRRAIARAAADIGNTIP